jgi:L-seryl-tRNA(Ser) seleniumtransferase
MTTESGGMERGLPSVDRLLRAVPGWCGLPGPLAAMVVRRVVSGWREAAAGGVAPPEFGEAVAVVRGEMELLARRRIGVVINGTGVLLHTNLGRAPLAAGVAARVAEVASSYHNLELDMETGERGARGEFLETSLALLAGAEAATVVNNCAAALVLILRHLTGGGRREVVISRGQLVEIGGGFRVPEILETSGAVLREVGSTNRTTVEDYRRAMGAGTALVLRVHRSNFVMEGFTGEPGLEELAAVAREGGVPLVEDLGSGAVVDTAQFEGLGHEPTAAESLAAGVDLVCTSGDKLFGGPQSGLIFGRAEMVRGLKRDPMYRALRCDRLAYVALQETAAMSLEAGLGRAASGVPLMAMLGVGMEELEERTVAVMEKARAGGGKVELAVVRTEARCGGGTMPKGVIPSVGLRVALSGVGAEDVARRLRLGRPAVLGRIAGGAVLVDLRTVLPGQDGALGEVLGRLG